MLKNYIKVLLIDKNVNKKDFYQCQSCATDILLLTIKEIIIDIVEVNSNWMISKTRLNFNMLTIFKSNLIRNKIFKFQGIKQNKKE
jgi:hypothetical protein